MSFSVGETIAQKYEVLRQLGAGGFGTVYLVHSRETGENYALKTFHDEFLLDDRARQLFRKEALMWINLGWHPCTVAAHAVEQIHGRLCVLSEFVPANENSLVSVSAQDVLRRGPLDLRTTLLWSIQ